MLRVLILIGFVVVVIGLVWVLQADGGEAGGLNYPQRVSLMSDWATIILVFVAVGALVYAAREVGAIHTANYQAFLQSRAAVLLNLWHQWDADTFSAITDDFKNFREQTDKDIEREFHHLRPDELREKSEEVFAKIVGDMKKNDLKKYDRFVRIVSFFETVGHVSKHGYIPKEDVIDLFGGAILGAGRVFYRHIKQIQSTPGTTGRAWEYFIWLVDEARKVAKEHYRDS